MAPDPARPKNTYIREDKLLPHLPALHLRLTTPAVRARRRTRAGADVIGTASPGEVIGYLREHEITLTWNPAAATVQAGATQTESRWELAVRGSLRYWTTTARTSIPRYAAGWPARRTSGSPCTSPPPAVPG